jgi:hypothetical protein
MTTRTYLFIGLCFAGLIFLIGMVFGEDIAAWATLQKGEAAARGQGVFEYLVFEPIRFTFDVNTRIIGSVIVIFAWPMVIVLFVLMLLGLVIMSGIDTNNRLGIVGSILAPFWWQ